MRMNALATGLGTLSAVFILSGCFVEAEEDHAQCANDTTREVPCGAYGTGVQTQRCTGFRWQDDGFCNDDTQCVAGATQSVACGINDRGAQSQRCEKGDWTDAGACADPDTCIDGTEEEAACGPLDSGTQMRTCVRGTFGPFGACEDALACDDGDVQSDVCGFNGRGEKTRACVENMWADEFGPCTDPDVCVDAETKTAICSEMGSFGAKIRESTCVAGSWTEFGPCYESATCASGAVEPLECGSDGKGYQTRTCANGSWTIFSACQQTAAHILGDGMLLMALVGGEDSAQPRMWGDNRDGKLAMPNRPVEAVTYPQLSLAPSPTATDGSVAGRFSASITHACAIDASDALYCWGSNAHGQLARDPAALAASDTPLPANIIGGATAVAVGDGFTCAISVSGAVYCWGLNDESQLGLPGGNRDKPTRVTTDVSTDVSTAIVAGAAHACAIREKTVQCWGRNTEFQASPTKVDPILSPTLHPKLSVYPDRTPPVTRSSIIGIAAGANHTLVAWEGQVSVGKFFVRALIGVGRSENGQLGTTQTKPVQQPLTLASWNRTKGDAPDPFTLNANGNVSCVITSMSQGLRCTGENASGAIAPVATARLTTLTPAPSDLDPDAEGISAAALGDNYLCVLLSQTKRIRCRGANLFGQLGDGTTTSRAAAAYVLHRDNDQ